MARLTRSTYCTLALLCLAAVVRASAGKAADADDEEMLYLIFTPQCFGVFNEGLEQLFLKFDVAGILARFDYYLPCALKIISKAMGYAIVAFSSILKIPQIYPIVKNKDVTGLAPVRGVPRPHSRTLALSHSPLHAP
jgi:hypothetical protein